MTPSSSPPTRTVRVDPRIAERRRQVAAERRRRARRLTVASAVTLTALLGAYGLSRTALFDVDRLVVAGPERTSVEEVLTAAGIEPGDQLLDVDPERSARAVESLPWVQDASIQRTVGGTVRIEVTERRPLATVADDAGRRMLVDGEGRVLAPAPADAPDPAAVDLVAVEGLVAPAPGQQLGDTARTSLDVAARLTPGLRARVATLATGPDGHVTLALRPEGRALLGPPTDLDAKLGSLVTVLSQVDLDDLAEINLTVADLPTVVRHR